MTQLEKVRYYSALYLNGILTREQALHRSRNVAKKMEWWMEPVSKEELKIIYRRHKNG